MKIINSPLSRGLLKGISASLILFAFAYLLFPFLPAMLAGSILAFALSGTFNKLKSMGFSRLLALSALLLSISLLVLVPVFIFFIRGSAVLTHTLSAPGFALKLKEMQNKLMELAGKITPALGISQNDMQTYIDKVASESTGFIFSLFNNILSEIPNLLLFLLITLISLYFFLYKECEIRALFDRYYYFHSSNADRFIRVMKSSCRIVFLSNMVTGFVQAALVTIGAIIFGIEEWFLVFFITFIASFIPIIGAGPIAASLALYSFAVGNSVAGIGMLVISVIAGTADNFIRPYLASRGDVEVPGVLSFLAVLGGVITMGLPGLFLGPLIASLTFGGIPILVEEFFPKAIDIKDEKY